MHILMKDICKSFGSNNVLKNAGIELKEAEIHALMGENGAGKSTLMKILYLEKFILLKCLMKNVLLIKLVI